MLRELSRLVTPWSIIMAMQIVMDCSLTSASYERKTLSTMFSKPTPKNTQPHRNERTAPLDCSAVKSGTAARATRLGLIALVTLITTSNDTLADDMTGQASVTDGDTSEIRSTRIFSVL